MQSIQPANTRSKEIYAIQPANTRSKEMQSIQPANTKSKEMQSIQPANTRTKEMQSIQPVNTRTKEMQSIQPGNANCKCIHVSYVSSSIRGCKITFEDDISMHPGRDHSQICLRLTRSTHTAMCSRHPVQHVPWEIRFINDNS